MTNTSTTAFTEQDFLALVTKICNADYPSEELLDEAVSLFERIAEHPDKSDLIYYPKDGQDSPEAIVQIVKQWRMAQGKSGFKI